MDHHLALLGHKVKDSVTGFTGTVTTIGFDLYGCVQAIVTPNVEPKSGKRVDGEWFDVKRLQKVSIKPVMARPIFENVAGGERKPAASRQPLL